MTHCGCNTTPCGCRSSGLAIAPGGAHGGRACACGGRGCATCEPRAFIRPRFFAGQLLTDEDLALLGDYVVGKNRLHNRALWGPGVVCGLDVDCDPCGDGHVVVQPGYAITCCGDDIVVPCPEPVDILALIRDLTRSALGAECADPCEQPRYQRAVAPAPPANTPGAILAGRLPDPKAPVRRYYLYIRYAEALTDPVSPYATDEPCAGQACEPTRVREGHTYELRCENDNPHFPGLGDHVLECVGSLEQVKAAAADATVLNRVALRLASAQRVLAATPEPVFMAADAAALATASAALRDALAAMAPAPPTGGQPAAAPDPARIRTAIEALRVAASLFARLVATPVAQRPQIDATVIDQAQRTIAEGRKTLSAALPSAGLPPAEAAEAQATLGLTEQFERLSEPPPQLTYAQRLWTLGAPLNDALAREARAAQARVLGYLAPRLRATRRRSDCLLLAQYEAIRPIGEAPIDAPSVAALSQGATATSQVLARDIFECLCEGLNPPCHGCDDQAVLLAEICVQDCVVVDICEMVRRFVITWPSVRYWTDVPGIGINAIGELFEMLCCALRGQVGSGCGPGAGLGTGITALTRAPLASLLAPRLAARAGAVEEPLGPLGDLLAMIEPLATATAVVPGNAPAVVDPAVERVIRSRVDEAVAFALESTRRELAALREEIGQPRRRRGPS